jgi:hypothetical protein
LQLDGEPTVGILDWLVNCFLYWGFFSFKYVEHSLVINEQIFADWLSQASQEKKPVYLKEENTLG